MRQIRITQRHQLDLHILLSRGQFLFQLLDILFLRTFQKTGCVAVNPVASTKRLSITGEIRCHTLHLVHLPGLHDQETVGDQEAQLDRQIRPIQRHPHAKFPFRLHQRQRHQEL